jgi:hypothetical protein
MIISRIVVFAGLWALFAASGVAAQAPGLGVWQPSVDGRPAAGGPVLTTPIVPADPVGTLPPVVKPQHFARYSIDKFTAKSGETAALPTRPAPIADLMRRDYDPDVPLPHPDLAEMAPPDSRSEGPRPYLHVQREEHGGGVLGLNGVVGLTVPFPTSRVGGR